MGEPHLGQVPQERDSRRRPAGRAADTKRPCERPWQSPGGALELRWPFRDVPNQARSLGQSLVWAALGRGVNLDKAAPFIQGQIPERDTQLSEANSSREDGRFLQNSIVSVIGPLGMKESRLVGLVRPGKLKGHHLTSSPSPDVAL